jgi:hypothetical protein
MLTMMKMRSEGWCGRLVRHKQTQAGAQQALAREPTSPSQWTSTAVIAAERVAMVGEAIRRLPEPQRVALTMAAAGGMTSTGLAIFQRIVGTPTHAAA